MAPTVLKDSETGRPRGAGEPRSKSQIGRGWNDRERNWDVAGNRNETVEPTARRRRIIITPPEGCDPPRVSPLIEFVDQIGPSHGCRRILAGQIAHLPILPRTDRDTKSLSARVMHQFEIAVDAPVPARGCSGDHAPVVGTSRWSGKDWLPLGFRENV
jgi:hypothetical protein